MDVHWVNSNEHAEHAFPHCALRTPRLPQRVMGWSMAENGPARANSARSWSLCADQTTTPRKYVC